MSELTLEQALVLLDESRQHNAAMMDRLYESLGIDGSDGEVRFKLVMIEIEELKQERDELVAQVEALKSSLNFVASVYSGDNTEEHSKFVEWVSIHRLITSESPAQCLRDIQAEAGRIGYLQGVHDWQLAESKYEDFDTQSRSLNYAERVKAGEK